MTPEQILARRGQQHVLRFCGELSREEREAFFRQIENIDWDTVELWRNPEDLSGKGRIEPIAGLDLAQIAHRRSLYWGMGRDAVHAGKVGAVLLAGGQGTRLGSSEPKGMYPIGERTGASIFELLIRNLQAVVKACGRSVPLYIMTSEKNDRATRDFFEKFNYFGYPAEDVAFFMQEMAPSVDFYGRLLLEEKGRLALSPNGNGGWYSSLVRAGLDRDIFARGIEWLNVFSVDNVLQRIADPVFVGATIASGMNSGAKVVRKCDPHERVGVLCLENGLPTVIEYYELTEEMANLRDANGELAYSYGVTLNYLFRVDRLQEVAMQRIPVHVVKKKVPYLDGAGNLISPEQPNAYKFETLILDMIKYMGSCLPFEVDRMSEFAPVKNRTGADSVDSARYLLRMNGVDV